MIPRDHTLQPWNNRRLLKFKQSDMFDSVNSSTCMPSLNIQWHRISIRILPSRRMVLVIQIHIFKRSPTTGHRFRHFCSSINVKCIYIQIVINLGKLTPAQSIVIGTILNKRGQPGVKRGNSVVDKFVQKKILAVIWLNGTL